MGVETRRPPLPAPTDTSSLDETSSVATEVATNVTTRTDKTSYTIPEDGSPIVVSTHKKESRIGSHGRQKSQTSLLIEYFEGSKSADGKTKGRPSVRVKVTPSSRKSSATNRANDAVQITSIGADRKPSYTRRISLNSKTVETGAHESTELSHSSGSNLSAGPPVEIEVLNDGSDLSNARSSRGLQLAQNESNVSSMPPDSMLEEESTRAGAQYEVDEDTVTKYSYLAAPERTRSRSTSRERITQKVIEKLGQSPAKHRKTVSHDEAYESKERRRNKAHRDDDAYLDGSALSSNPVSSHRSYNSNVSQASRITNNARLLEKVEDTIKRILLPEITAIRDDQRAERKLRTYDDKHRGESSHLERRVSKSSSSPNIRSKPKVVLNREGDDPGTVLSRGDSEYKKSRRSSGERLTGRRSSGPRKSDGYDEEETTHSVRRRRSSKSGELGKTAAAGLAGAALTAAALKHHDSEQDLHKRRKRRSKSRSSRSRSNSIVDGVEETYTRKDTIPPMPMASHINDSDLTRTSLLSTDNDMTESTRTPIREVSRGSLNTGISPVSSRTAVRTPVSKDLGMSHNNRSIGSPRSIKERTAALSNAAGFETRHDKHVDADGYGSPMAKRGVHSPAQSVSSLRMQYEEPLVPSGLRPHSASSRPSVERLHKQAALNSAQSSPLGRPAHSRGHSEDFVTPAESRQRLLSREGSATPSGEDVEEWFNRQHLENEQLRSSYDNATNRASYQTNPYPEDEKRSFSSRDSVTELQRDRDVRGVGANPNYIHMPLGVESAVASLVEPSVLSSAARPASSVETPPKASYSDRMAEQLRARSKDDVPLYEGSTLSQTMPSPDRWAALKKHATSLSNSTGHVSSATNSPRQSPAKSLDTGSPVKLGASGVPLANDPIPEIGHFDDSKSDVSTNPSIIRGPLGGDPTGQSTWPYSPSPQAEPTSRDEASGYSKEAMLGAGLAGAAFGGAAIAHANRKPSVEHSLDDEEEEDDDEHHVLSQSKQYTHEPIDRNLTPTQGSPLVHKDEGYATDGGAITPKAERQYTRQEIAEYKRAMDANDPFTTEGKNARSIDGDSHGIASPLYDSATGKGIDNIQSKEIVWLMDHLTVRDAQRSARDTEIITTLVKTAADMRHNFEDMKRFIHEQDKIIMANTERGQEATVQKVLGGPRPQPAGSPRTPRTRSEEDIQTKRKGVLRRALKGLTGSRSSSDLSKIEDMLMQVLDNVEQLKHQGVTPKGAHNVYLDDDGMDSYEKLRAAPDSGYEPDGFAGTNSTPSQSGYFASAPQRGEKQMFHSGYNGRPGSENRVSTVMEGDEDEDLEPHERNVLDHQFEHNERLLTPGRDFRADATTSPTGLGSPTFHQRYSVSANETTPRAADRQSKHKSNASGIFGIPKISRWSKTTTSSAVPESPAFATNARPASTASRSSSELQQYDDDDVYALKDEDRLRSTQSLAREQAARAETRSVRSQASRLTRTPSPLIPSEASYRSRNKDDYEHSRELSPVQHDDFQAEQEIDDPKYKAIRNSILLQHPQPRQGSTSRHQSNLESKAHSYNDKSATNSDLSQRTVSDFDPNTWGSVGVAALNKSRFGQTEPLSPVSMGSPYTNKSSKDNTPLVPTARAQHQQTHVDDVYDDESTESEEEEWQPQYSNSGFARNANTWYSSPLGSGHLLEPIEEVRYSLETDSGRLSPEPQVTSARAVTARKITGPRPMGSRSTSAANPKDVETSGTVRRKPVPGTKTSNDTLDSQESESF